MTEEQKKVEDWFHKHGFILSSYKGTDDWREVLSTKFEWNIFDYKIPDYDRPRTTDDVMDDFANMTDPLF